MNSERLPLWTIVMSSRNTPNRSYHTAEQVISLKNALCMEGSIIKIN